MKTLLIVLVAIILSLTILIPALVSAQQTTEGQVAKATSPATAQDTVVVTQPSATVVGEDREDYVRPFSLAEIPLAPKLRLEFSAIKQGVCQVTYRPTELWLNRRLIQSIDFRRMAIGASQSLTINVPRNALKVGENLITIRTGSCRYAIDIMRLDSLTIAKD